MKFSERFMHTKMLQIVSFFHFIAQMSICTPHMGYISQFDEKFKKTWFWYFLRQKGLKALVYPFYPFFSKKYEILYLKFLQNKNFQKWTNSKEVRATSNLEFSILTIWPFFGTFPWLAEISTQSLDIACVRSNLAIKWL